MKPRIRLHTNWTAKHVSSLASQKYVTCICVCVCVHVLLSKHTCDNKTGNESYKTRRLSRFEFNVHFFEKGVGSVLHPAVVTGLTQSLTDKQLCHHYMISLRGISFRHVNIYLRQLMSSVLGCGTLAALPCSIGWNTDTLHSETHDAVPFWIVNITHWPLVKQTHSTTACDLYKLCFCTSLETSW